MLYRFKGIFDRDLQCHINSGSVNVQIKNDNHVFLLLIFSVCCLGYFSSHLEKTLGPSLRKNNLAP